MAPHGAFATAPSDHGTFMIVRLLHLSKVVESMDAGVPKKRIDVKFVQYPNA